jgi:copper chaperone CopZ
MKEIRNPANAILRLPAEDGVDRTLINKIIPILSDLYGVHSVEINHVTNTVAIEYDGQKITLEEIRSKIREIVVPISSEVRS